MNKGRNRLSSNFYRKLCDAIGADFRAGAGADGSLLPRLGLVDRPAVLMTPEGEKELAAVLAVCRGGRESRYYALGNGSNLLVSDAGYPGVMILLGSQFTESGLSGGAKRASMSWAPVCCFPVPPGRRRRME
ncbi:MAG: hypothetical protein ACLT76_08625 [Clostridium fessum]